jgi:hypothetical protein
MLRGKLAHGWKSKGGKRLRKEGGNVKPESHRAIAEMTTIATFNVNGVNGRIPVVLRWLVLPSQSSTPAFCAATAIVRKVTE